MISKKSVVAVAVAAALTFNAITPSRARAADTAVLVIGSIAAWVVVVTVGTLMTTNRKKPLFMQDTSPGQPDPLSRTRQDTMRFGSQCQPTADGQPLVCW